MTKKKDEIFEKLSALKPAVPTATRIRKKEQQAQSGENSEAFEIFMNNMSSVEKIREELFQDVEQIYSIILSGVFRIYSISYEMFKYNLNIFTTIFKREAKK
jgi:hypothetical protein